jgi:hypothetical protein
MTRINVLARAEWDLEDWQMQFDAIQTGLSDKLMTAFRKGIERIRQFPRRYAVYRRSIRICPLRPFQIGVFYRVEGDVVYALRVLDLRSNPKTLRQELGISH